jgi:hypothetical protein
MRKRHDANHLPCHPTLHQYNHKAGVGPDDDGTTRRALTVGDGESGRQWHARGHLLQEMHSIESGVRDDVGIPSGMVSVRDFQAL